MMVGVGKHRCLIGLSVCMVSVHVGVVGKHC